jgi:hypothetical protein
MKTNSHITLYNKYVHSTTRSELWLRTQIRDVVWEDRKAANVINSGLIEADQAAIFIPYARGILYRDPTTWQALVTKTGYWTLQVGDIIAQGLVTDEITGSFAITDLKKKYPSILSIRSVDTMNMGSISMWHWQVGAG